MSLFNRGGNTPRTIIVREITRSRNESFGESFMKDAALAAGPAAKITNNVYRKKALKAIEKRNAALGNESEYLNMLCNMNVGDNVSVGIEAECTKDMAKVKLGKVGSWLNIR